MRLPLATGNGAASFWAWTAALVALAIVAPFFLYPVFLMNALCMALFACAFNLLIGYVGLLSFGHAAFMGMGSYLAAYSAKMWGLSPELAIPDRRGGRGACSDWFSDISRSAARASISR